MTRQPVETIFLKEKKTTQVLRKESIFTGKSKAADRPREQQRLISFR